MRPKKVSVTKIFSIDSAHKLIDYNGACENLHGHTYKLEVTVTAEVDVYGFIIDFNILKDVVKDHIISKIDHKYFNDIFDFNPTCEHVAMWIWDRLEEQLHKNGVKMEKLVLWETPTSFATVTVR